MSDVDQESRSIIRSDCSGGGNRCRVSSGSCVAGPSPTPPQTAFSYLAIAVLMFFAAIFGMSQQLSGQTAWAYYFIPCGILIATILWFASKTGQKLAHSEMVRMKVSVEQCLDRIAKQSKNA